MRRLLLAISCLMLCAACAGGGRPSPPSGRRDVSRDDSAAADTGADDTTRDDSQTGDAPPSGPLQCVWHAPTADAFLRGSVALSAHCEHPAGIQDVVFAAGPARLTATAEGSGAYTAALDTTEMEDGPLTLQVAARAADGSEARFPRAVVVDNTPPTLALLTPSDGDRLVGDLVVSGTATDANGVAELCVWRDDELLGCDEELEAAEFSLTFDVGAVLTDLYTVRVAAVDRAGNSAEASVEVRIVTRPRFRGGVPEAVSALMSRTDTMVVADFTGDDVPDIAFGGPRGVVLRRGRGDGTFALAVKVLDNVPTLLFAADLDGDGRAELIWHQTSGREELVCVATAEGIGAGTALRMGECHPVQDRVYAFAYGDLDGDGIADLVFGSDRDTTSLGVLLGRPTDDAPPFFHSEVRYSRGVANVRSIVLADIDGDGVLDAVVGRNASRFSVFPGQGDGFFGIARNTELAGRGGSVAVGFFNGDQVADIAVSDAVEGVRVYLGEPGASEPWQFGQAQLRGKYQTGVNTAQVLVADLNDDGHEDILAICPANKYAIQLLGDGDGGFAEGLGFNLGPEPRAVHLVDLDGDGSLDIVALNQAQNTFVVMLRRGPASFDGAPEILLPFCPRTEPQLTGLVAHHFDRRVGPFDGNDLFVVGFTYSPGFGAQLLANALVRNPFDYPRPPAQRIEFNVSKAESLDFAAMTGKPVAVRAGDIDLDGHLDVIIATATAATASGPVAHQILVALGDSLGEFPEQVRLALGSAPSALAVCDINGHPANTLDIVVGMPGRGQLYPPSLLGGWLETTATGIDIHPVASAVLTGDPADLQCARINSDLTNDFLTVNTTGGDLNYLKGEWSERMVTGQLEALALADRPLRVTVADVDGDGLVDAVATTRNDIVIAFGARGGEVFDTATFLDHRGYDPHGVVVRDFNGDGLPDIAVTNRSRATVSIYVNSGDRRFIGPIDFHTSVNPTEIVAADFNADGCYDLAVLNSQGRTVTLLLAEGARCVKTQ
jgi:hypothetical protein